MMLVKRKIIIKFVLFTLAAYLITFFLQKWFDIKLEDVELSVKSAGVFAPIVYTTILFLGLTIPFNPVSDFLTVNVAALVFEPKIAVLATFTAHSLAITANYFLARRFGTFVLKRLVASKELKQLKELSKNINLTTIFGLRFALPVTAIGIDIVSYTAGFEKIKFTHFFIVSIVPWTALNLIYFYSTNLLRNKSLMLFFIPAVVLILIPSVFLVLRRKGKF